MRGDGGNLVGGPSFELDVERERVGEQRGHLRADQHVVRQTEDGEITTKLREEKVERDCERGGEDAGGLTPPPLLPQAATLSLILHFI